MRACAGGRGAFTVSTPDSVTEARVLEYLHGRLPVATPELLAHGEYENGWHYLLMSQLPGTELAAAWPAIPRPPWTPWPRPGSAPPERRHDPPDPDPAPARTDPRSPGSAFNRLES